MIHVHRPLWKNGMLEMGFSAENGSGKMPFFRHCNINSKNTKFRPFSLDKLLYIVQNIFLSVAKLHHPKEEAMYLQNRLKRLILIL